jgi:hypothetical protein
MSFNSSSSCSSLSVVPFLIKSSQYGESMQMENQYSKVSPYRISSICLQAIDIEGIRYITMIMMNGSILTKNQSYFEGVSNQ